VQVAPGGPSTRSSADPRAGGGALSRIAGSATGDAGNTGDSRAARGIEPALIKELEKQFGFDKPPLERSDDDEELCDLRFRQELLPRPAAAAHRREASGIDLARLWTTLLIYLISIPLGIRKAVRDGSAFDIWTSAVIIVGYACRAFLGVLSSSLRGGSYFSWFRCVPWSSDNGRSLGTSCTRGSDYFGNLTLPIVA